MHNGTIFYGGGVHGIYQVIGDMLKPVKNNVTRRLKIKTDCMSYKGLQIIITFLLTVTAWIFFRADSITIALRIYKRILLKWNPWVFFTGKLYTLGLTQVEIHILLIALLALFIVDLIKYKFNLNLDEFLNQQNIWFKWLVLMFLIGMIIIYGEYGNAFDAQQFIYFQF